MGELKCMNEIEKKVPGTFTRGLREKITDTRAFDTDRICIKEDELSYVIGKEAATQKKLAVAAGAILQFVGRYAFIAGSYKERKRCKEYIGWLLQQMHIPMNCKGWVTGNRGTELRRMEQETGVYMFMALDGRGEERLIIFSHDPGSKTSTQGRMAAERLVNELVQEKLRDDGDRGNSRARSNSRPGSPPRGRPDSRRREPSPPPRRNDSRAKSPPRGRSPAGRSDRSTPRGGRSDYYSRGGGGRGGGRDSRSWSRRR